MTKYTCDECGSSDIQVRIFAWIDANTVGADGFDYNKIQFETEDRDDAHFCKGCQRNTRVTDISKTVTQ